MNAYHFEKISKVTISKEAWDILEKYYDGGDKVKQVKIQYLRKKYEFIVMREDQKISDYFSKFIVTLNQMNTCGKAITDHQVVEKLMISLTSRFDFIVVAIQESKYLKNRRTWEFFRGSWIHDDW